MKPPLLIEEYFLSKRGKRGRKRYERGDGDCTHGPELHAWPSLSTVPANGDPSERAGEQEEQRKAEDGSRAGD